MNHKKFIQITHIRMSMCVPMSVCEHMRENSEKFTLKCLSSNITSHEEQFYLHRLKSSLSKRVKFINIFSCQTLF